MDPSSALEYQKEIARLHEVITQQGEVITQKDQESAQKDQVIAQKDQESAQKDQVIAQQGEELTLRRKTTLSEYLQLAHECLSVPMNYNQSNIIANTSGTSTHNVKFFCPKDLAQIPDFSTLQKQVYDKFVSIIPEGEKLFESRDHMNSLKRRIQSTIINSEQLLTAMQDDSILSPIKTLLSVLPRFQTEENGFNLGSDIYYDSNLQRFSKSRSKDNEAKTKDRTVPLPQTSKDFANVSNLPLNVPIDMICVTHEAQTDTPKIAHVIEYKAPHKLTRKHIEFGVKSMTIFTNVVCRGTLPNDKTSVESLTYDSEDRSASALCQTYTYMLQLGLEYGYVSTGEAFIFLKIDYSQPDILHYHYYLQPSNIADCSFEEGPLYQALTFTLLSLDSTMQTNDVKHAAIQGLNVWIKDPKRVLDSAIAADRAAGVDTSAEENVRDAGDEHPPDQRPRKRAKKGGCADKNYQGRSPSPSPSPDRQTRSVAIRNRARPGPSSLSTTTTASSENSEAPPSDSQDPSSNQLSAHVAKRSQKLTGMPKVDPLRPYCSHACLLSLLSNDYMDPDCPNYDKHMQASISDSLTTPILNTQDPLKKAEVKSQRESDHLHPLTYREWLERLRAQMKRTLDRGIRSLETHGARGIMFQVALLEYEYVFIAKATIRELASDLRFEENIYERLRPLQGKVVPVHLGSVDLTPLGRIYYYGFLLELVYFALYSYAGSPIPYDEAVDDSVLLKRIRVAYDELHECGILQNDARSSNILVDDQRTVMLIDFERAYYVDDQDLDDSVVDQADSADTDRKDSQAMESQVQDSQKRSDAASAEGAIPREQSRPQAQAPPTQELEVMETGRLLCVPPSGPRASSLDSDTTLVCADRDDEEVERGRGRWRFGEELGPHERAVSWTSSRGSTKPLASKYTKTNANTKADGAGVGNVVHGRDESEDTQMNEERYIRLDSARVVRVYTRSSRSAMKFISRPYSILVQAVGPYWHDVDDGEDEEVDDSGRVVRRWRWRDAVQMERDRVCDAAHNFVWDNCCPVPNLWHPEDHPKADREIPRKALVEGEQAGERRGAGERGEEVGKEGLAGRGVGICATTYNGRTVYVPYALAAMSTTTTTTTTKEDVKKRNGGTVMGIDEQDVKRVKREAS